MERKYAIPTHLKQLLSLEQVYSYRVIPYQEDNGVLYLKTDSTNGQDLKRELQIILGRSVELSNTDSSTIQQYLVENYREVRKNIKKIGASQDFLLKIIQEAEGIGSSDIHIESEEKGGRVRFRIDGKLVEIYSINKQEYPKIINRIKVMSQLDIAEKRLPQDGRISLSLTDDKLDIRVSTLPTLYGEKVVLRILAKDSDNIELEHLGFTSQELELYLMNLQKTTGIVLISGPTGSGKTTTLYATLKKLNDGSINILTIEDPIEYAVKGISQVQLKESIGLDFTKALRTFLRQDPDVIMVGEIRDVETANMAIRAALTGHLVLATIHTNSAWATVTRLIDMGIPPFLISSVLNMSIAQRLVRKLCPYCKVEQSLLDESVSIDRKLLKDVKSIYLPIGCAKCYNTGYKGRKAIYEIIPINKALEKEIRNNQLDIHSYMDEIGLQTLREHALDLIRKGETSIEEVFNLLIE